MRFLNGLLSVVSFPFTLFRVIGLKFILWAAALIFIIVTLGTAWTLFVAYAAVAFALFKWGPSDKSGMATFTLAPTRGSPYALFAPVVLIFLFPLAIIGAMVGSTSSNER